MFRVHHNDTTLVFPLKFYGTKEFCVERLLTEFFAICYLVEDTPKFDTMDQAREILRRVQEWLHLQDKCKRGFATPYGKHIHPSMERIAEIYLMATMSPWGFRTHDSDDGKLNTNFSKS